MTQLNDFGVTVKKRLIDIGKNQAWLIDEGKSRSGKYMDNSYLNRLMTSKATSSPMVETIKEILEIGEF